MNLLVVRPNTTNSALVGFNFLAIPIFFVRPLDSRAILSVRWDKAVGIELDLY